MNLQPKLYSLWLSSLKTIRESDSKRYILVVDATPQKMKSLHGADAKVDMFINLISMDFLKFRLTASVIKVTESD